MKKHKIKKAFGQSFLLIEGKFTPLHSTWNEIAKQVKNPQGNSTYSQNKTISLTKNGGVMYPVQVIGFQYPGGDHMKPPQFAFLKIGKGNQVIKL